MAKRQTDLCACGSGLPFSHCHGDSRNEYARAQARREAEQIPMLFPSVRVRDAALEGFLERVAQSYPDGDEVPAGVIEEGLALLHEREWTRVVELWTTPYEDRWQSLTAAAADIPAAERALVVGALRAGVAERQATPRELLEPLEDGRLRRSPAAALALVLPPLFVWSIDEARAAAVAHAATRRPRARLDAAERLAHALMSFDHVRRVRRLCARLVAELPVDGLPGASALLDMACADGARDVGAARTASAALLVASAGYITPAI